MYHLRRFTIVVVSFLLLVFLLWFLPRVLNPTPPSREKELADKRWIDSSPYWLDRQACRWLSLCGLHHVRPDPPTRPERDDPDDGELRLQLRSVGGDWRDAERWAEAGERRRQIRRGGERELKEIPKYVLDYAPLVHLCSEENFWPGDIAEHVRHMTAMTSDGPVNGSGPWDLHNLHLLNKQPGKVFLMSNDDVESRPEWLHSHAGIPAPFDDDDGEGREAPDTRGQADRDADDGDWHSLYDTTWFDVGKEQPLHRIAGPRKFTPSSHSHSSRLIQKLLQRHRLSGLSGFSAEHSRQYKPDAQGYSKAPAILILVDKGSGILDAFWMFFYSYNLGQTVLGVRYGNHVGDWEHCMVRFEDGVPRGIFFSEHEGGQAYAFEAVEKRRVSGSNGTHHLRPVIYSAVGSHALYPLPGTHPYVLPFKMLKDETDKGPNWDPARHFMAYHYDYLAPEPEDPGEEPASLTPSAENPDAPTSWFHYAGAWGDEFYSLADERQWRLFGQYHYVTGPQGPRFKRLDRQKICQRDRCKILYSLKPGQTWYG